MLHDNLLLRTKLTPPRLHRRVLARPGLVAKLWEALEYRLTIVQAGTGYGKTTTLAALTTNDVPLFWYTLDDSDNDPQQFLSYLISGFRMHLPDLPETPSGLLGEVSSGSMAGRWSLIIDALVNGLVERLEGPAMLVLDDYHLVAKSSEIIGLTDRLITHGPADLHVVIATRHPCTLPGMTTWRAKGHLLEISRTDLAFRPAEIEALFREAYDMTLTASEVASLADKTEGWPIALQLAWQSLRSGAAASVTDLLTGAHGGASLAALFDYLAHELLDRQPPEIAAFLRETSVLRELTPDACDAVRDAAPTVGGSQPATTHPTLTGRDASVAGVEAHPMPFAGPQSEVILRRLHDLDLFVVSLSEGHHRYHHLFHDFLRAQAAADPEAVCARHRRAARFYQDHGSPEEAVHHWLAAQAHDAAAAAIEAAGEALLRAGRLGTLATWVDALPSDVIAARPLLQAYLGDISRLRSRFDEALNWYTAAEQTWRARGDPAGISRALHGQAMVYLDTVRPAEAEQLLQEAVRLFERLDDRQTRARLLELMAENKLNTGKPEEAERLRAEARTLREEGPTEDTLSLRAKIRTGRLDEAQRILESWAEAERTAAEQGQSRPPRGHRETVLLLSLIHSLRGEPEQALARAREGIALGERLDSPFITAVAHMRLGHAWQLARAIPPALPGEGTGVHAEAIRCYQTAIAVGDQLSVRRTRAEAMWGLTRAYGYQGDLQAAQRAATEGVEIGRWAGDPWVASLTQLALGASLVLAGHTPQAAELLSQVLAAFRDCGDLYGRAAARLWLALAYRELRQSEHLALCLEILLELCETHGYDCLLIAPTLVGVPDPRRNVPLLLEARNRGLRPAYITRLLAQIGLPDVEVHPGYQLRVQTLGAFRVWRGGSEVSPRSWQRDKARQLFQLLLTQRDRWLQRDEITDRLWPDLSPEAATRDFKVALNALNKAVEPGRLSDAPFAFVVRDGSAYRLRSDADLWHDAAVFRKECEQGLHRLAHGELETGISSLQAGLQLYAGDYLPDALYEDWASEERARLLALYLRAAERLADVFVERGRYDEGIKLCEAILAKDPCWEHAYRLLMTAYTRQGNRPQAFRTYQRCVSALRTELEVAPSSETVSLYWRIAGEMETSASVTPS